MRGTPTRPAKRAPPAAKQVEIQAFLLQPGTSRVGVRYVTVNEIVYSTLEELGCGFALRV